MEKVRAFSDELVEFDFPVTALIGTNGGGKSTVLGAAAIAYKSIRPALFFPKSSLGDETMRDWGMVYDLIDKSKNPTHSFQRKARFKNAKWARDDLIDFGPHFRRRERAPPEIMSDGLVPGVKVPRNLSALFSPFLAEREKFKLVGSLRPPLRN